MTVSVRKSVADIHTDVAEWKAAGETIALVPTMGALHSGHVALVNRAREIADRVVVSIFVNPLQFGAGEDFDHYPRTLADDVAALEGRGVDAVFAPSVTDIYPDGPDSGPLVSAGAVGDLFEGVDRPGHFDGVVTVVSRLFDVVGCDWAVFGQKDAQQVCVVQQMAQKRIPPVAISVVETVRDDDGLALSSRNRFLSADARASATGVPRVVGALADFLETNPADRLTETQISQALSEAVEELSSEDCIVHYLDVVSAETFEPWRGSAADSVVVIVACTIGGVRLLDAVSVTVTSAAGD